MASEASDLSQPTSRADSAGAALIARLDRIPIWSLSYLFIGIIGVGFLFTFFDIFDINVSFIQTCTQIVPKCLPGPPPGLTAAPPGLVLASDMLGLPVLLNLVGYVIGALILSPLADRFGRRDILLVTLIITGLGSLMNAFVGDYATFNIARIITGIGVGADLALVATYINEVAPGNGRAKYTSLVFIMSSLGAFLGIWLGLWLTTPAAPFPNGLSFAQATVQISGGLPQFAGNGWRIMYGIGALLALVGILLRFRLPESPRWLLSQGRIEEADHIVTDMEHRAMRRMTNLPPIGSELHFHVGEKHATYLEILGNPVYLRRTLLLFSMWFIAFITVYTIGSGLTTVLSGLGYPPPEAGLIVAFGTFGFIAVALFDYGFGEMLERKYWLPISAVLTIIGGLIIAISGSGNFWVTAIGSIILFIGFNLFVPMAWAWSAENYPTRARATGFALVDGIGHVGGGIGILLIAGNIKTLGTIGTFLVIGGCLVVAAVIAQFGTSTKTRRLDEVSP
ncbi:MAG TPA: MFS transporter [Ktedonobacteraceae bacterium]|nr:MFS transporter [Ktedonobacteraceae bacterium]